MRMNGFSDTASRDKHHGTLKLWPHAWWKTLKAHDKEVEQKKKKPLIESNNPPPCVFVWVCICVRLLRKANLFISSDRENRSFNPRCFMSIAEAKEEEEKVLELLSVYIFVSRTVVASKARKRRKTNNGSRVFPLLSLLRNCLHFKTFLRSLRLFSNESFREIGKRKRNNFPVCFGIGKSKRVK